MLLVIDVGNTNICGGVFDSGRLIQSLRIHTVPKKTEDEYSSIFKAILVDRGVDPRSVAEVVVSSVVPALTESIQAMCERLFGVTPVMLGPAIYNKLPLGVPSPHEIGADLVADALAAWTKTGGACIVVDFGTALTFTCVGRDSRILGVSIAPGLGTAVNALSRDTAQLPFVRLAAPPSVIGTDTVMSIQAGVVHGYVGLVEHMIGRMKAEMGGPVKVIATGGLCRVVADLTSVFDAVDPDLTLDGLALVADYVAGRI
ncbi:MAG: type III pantothenate kinase [Spirochaetaceae bacterium]|nr:type III pantothenate kinase [Spirochaetaceae bacterium]